MKLADIADALSGRVIGNADLDVSRLVHPADVSGPWDLALALSDEAAGALADSAAGAAVVRERDVVAMRDDASWIVYTGPERAAVAILTGLFDLAPVVASGVHPTAVVSDDVELGDGVSIAAGCVVGPGSVIGAGTRLLANVTVGADVQLGARCILHSGTVVGDRVEIGARVIIQPNVVIGGDGFSFLPAGPVERGGGGGAHPQRINSLGTVIIEDDVEIGACTTIDRATIRATRIGRATKIDNQVQIAHNVVVGEACLICGKAGLAGSARLGDRVIVAASVGINDHVTVGDDAIIGAGAGVISRVKPGEHVIGQPAILRGTYFERLLNIGRLRRIIPKFNELLRRVAALEEAARASDQGDRSDSIGGDND
ncbi:MAG: UDP-3-O-(3-hydroxymyristoyl)glucosamine N-acyltransferase [Alphaproteobacteria bacterium]